MIDKPIQENAVRGMTEVHWFRVQGFRVQGFRVQGLMV